MSLTCTISRQHWGSYCSQVQHASKAPETLKCSFICVWETLQCRGNGRTWSVPWCAKPFDWGSWNAVLSLKTLRGNNLPSRVNHTTTLEFSKPLKPWNSSRDLANGILNCMTDSGNRICDRAASPGYQTAWLTAWRSSKGRKGLIPSCLHPVFVLRPLEILGILKFFWQLLWSWYFLDGLLECAASSYL